MREYRPCVSEDIKETLCEKEGIYKPVQHFSYVEYKKGTCRSYRRICISCGQTQGSLKSNDELYINDAHNLLKKMGYTIDGEKSIHQQFLQKYNILIDEPI